MKTKKILKTAAIILLTILIILAGYIIYLYASYHRIEDNKKLEVETVSENDKEGDTCQQKKNTPRLHIISVSEHIRRSTVSLWTAEKTPGRRARRVRRRL